MLKRGREEEELEQLKRLRIHADSEPSQSDPNAFNKTLGQIVQERRKQREREIAEQLMQAYQPFNKSLGELVKSRRQN